MIKQFLLALSFLTRLPIPKRMNFNEISLARAAWAFPLVGIIVGLLGSCAYMLALHYEVKRALAAWLAIGACLLITGGLHEDGLADTADGLAHGRDREQKLAIMRDSRIGSYGVIALIIMLSLRANAIASFSNGFDAFVTCAAAAALSRASIVFLMVATPYARQDGLAAMAGKPTMNAALCALWISVIPLLFLIKLNIVLPCLLALVITCGIIKHLASRHFGGITGDVLGATQQVTEVVMLIILSSNLPL